MFDTARLNRLIDEIAAGQSSFNLPGGANSANLLVHLVEMHHWIDDLQVTVP
jgi:hypothetical protein